MRHATRVPIIAILGAISATATLTAAAGAGPASWAVKTAPTDMLARYTAGGPMRAPSGPIPDVTWSRVAAGGSAPDRALHSMIFDPANDDFWVFGGLQADFQGNNFSNSVYRLDAADPDALWRKMSIGGVQPPPLTFHTATYDPLRHRMIVYGGQTDRTSTSRTVADPADLWYLDLKDPDNPAWSYAHVPGNPVRRFGHAAVYDPMTDALIVTGGVDAREDTLDSSYALMLGESPPRWVRLANAGFNARAGHAMVLDDAHQRLVVYGGLTDFSRVVSTADMSQLDLSSGLDGADRWTRLTPANPGLKRGFMATVFDPGSRLLWVQGGFVSSNSILNDLSVLDLSVAPPTWTRTLNVANGPLQRFAHVAALDPARGRILFQGGSPDNNRTLSDTRALTGLAVGAPTATATPTDDAAATATATATPTATATATNTPSPSPTVSSTTSPTTSPTLGPTATPSASATATATATSGPSPTATATATVSAPPPSPGSLFLPLTLNAASVREPLVPTPTVTSPPATPTATSSSPTPTQAALEIVGQLGGESNAVVASGDNAFAGFGPQVVTLDISGSGELVPRWQSGVLRANVQALALDGDHLFVGAGGWSVLDVSDPTAPVAISENNAPQGIREIAIDGDRLYVAHTGGLTILDVSDLASPQRLGAINPAFPYALAVDGDIAYLGTFSGLMALDVSDPSQPRQLGVADLGTTVYDIELVGNIAFLGTSGQLQILDVQDATQPTVIGSLDILGDAYAVDVAGDVALVAGLDLAAVDVSDPSAPALIATMPSTATSVSAVTRAGNRAVASYSDGGLRVFDITDPSAAADQAALRLPGRVFSLALGTDRIYLSGAETRVVDATNPSALRVTDRLSDGPLAAAVAAGAGRLYVSTGFSNGLLVYDTSGGAPALLSATSILNDVFDLEPRGPLLFGAQFDGGLWIGDVADATAPQSIITVGGTGRGRAVAVDTGLALLAAESAGVSLVDVSTPASAHAVGTITGQTKAFDIAADARVAFVAGVAPTFGVWNVADPASPQPLGSLDDGATAYGVAIAGDRAYLAENRGIRALDISDPTVPRDLGLYAPFGIYDAIAVAGNRVAAVGAAGLVVLRAP